MTPIEPPSLDRIRLELDDLRAARIRYEQALTNAGRSANIGAAFLLIGLLMFIFTSWYGLSFPLMFLGGLGWIIGASNRATAKKQIVSTDASITTLKEQIK